MFNDSYSSPTVANCIFSRNSARDGTGGGMHNDWYSSPTLTNCIFTGNSVYFGGGGMFNESYSSPTVTNCIVWGNSPAQIAGGGSIEYSDIEGGREGEGNIDADPLFVDADNDDYHLLPASPCIDAGDPNYVAGPNETDLDGNPRVMNGRIDMGAYELNPLDLLLDLTENIFDLELQRGIENSLLAKLNAALGALEDENENNDIAAINCLGAFINAVEAQRGKKIPEADADDMIASAQGIIAVLNRM